MQVVRKDDFMNHLMVLKRELDSDLKDGIVHGMLVSRLSGLLAKELGYDEEFCNEIKIAGMLHDIGKLKLTPYIYGRQDDTLQVEEMQYMRMHSTFSRDILKEQGYSDTILEAVYHHHENYDGSGYPHNLKGEDIPLGARIIRACDVFAALVSDRPYREAFDIDTAMELMVDEVKNFDMNIFLAFQRVIYFEKFNDLVKYKLFDEKMLYEELVQNDAP